MRTARREELRALLGALGHFGQAPVQPSCKNMPMVALMAMAPSRPTRSRTRAAAGPSSNDPTFLEEHAEDGNHEHGALTPSSPSNKRSGEAAK